MTGSTPRRWQPGDTVALRYLTRMTGQPGAAWPLVVVEDRDDLVALHLPRGTRFTQIRRSGGSFQRVWDTWRRDTLRLMFPGCAYSVWLFWGDEGSQRSFRGYYVNMEEPFRRTSIGFDMNDHQLDIVVSPDFAWQWKDEDVFEEFVRVGNYSQEFELYVRQEAARAIELIEGRRSPFSDGWEQWEPDPSWPMPELPPGWAEVPPAPWDRAGWAYPKRS